MAVMTVIPTSNVLLEDIRDTLNNAGASVANDPTTFFTSAAKINKWAKYKPVHYPVDFLNDDRRWQGYGTCGFQESSIRFDSSDELVAAHKAGTTFKYVLPTGTSASPYRLGDFRGYYPSAKAPIWSLSAEGQIYTNDTSSTMSFTILGNGDVDSDYNLTMKDIMPDGATSLSDYYFAVIIVNSSGGIEFTQMSDSTIGTSSSFTKTATISQSQLGDVGNYTAYPCFVNATGKDFIACPIGAVSFSVLTSKDTGKVGWMAGTGYWQQTGGKKTFVAQLAYTEEYKGITVKVSAKVLRSGSYEIVGSTQDVTLPTTPDSTSADGKNYYYNYSYSTISDTQDDDVFYFFVYWGNNYANEASIELKETTEPLE